LSTSFSPICWTLWLKNENEMKFKEEEFPALWPHALRVSLVMIRLYSFSVFSDSVHFNHSSQVKDTQELIFLSRSPSSLSFILRHLFQWTQQSNCENEKAIEDTMMFSSMKGMHVSFFLSFSLLSSHCSRDNRLWIARHNLTLSIIILSFYCSLLPYSYCHLTIIVNKDQTWNWLSWKANYRNNSIKEVSKMQLTWIISNEKAQNGIRNNLSFLVKTSFDKAFQLW
jgi:hypothetical protein